MTLEVALPPGTNYVRVYPYTSTAGKSFKIVALWAYRGSASSGPAWPIYDDEAYLGHIAKNSRVELERLAPAVDYAIEIKETVVSDFQAVTLPATDPVLISAHTLPFRGWGGVYTPAGVSFNAIRAALIGRADTPVEG